MKHPKLLPVIDVLEGQVVHAVRGERHAYRPIKSRLCDSARPEDVAQVFAERLAFDEVYVADLDAIQGRPVQWNALEAIHAQRCRMWLDAGLVNLANVWRLMEELEQRELDDTSIVIGLESWRACEQLAAAVKLAGDTTTVFSIDLRSGAPLTSGSSWPAEPLDIARLAIEQGVARLLVLDLARVGSEEGPATVDLCAEIKTRWPRVQLACGGGIRDAADCRRLAEVGCDVLLVATALHRGEFGARDGESTNNTSSMSKRA